MNQSLQELEYAAQLLFAPQSLITVEQRQAAEQVFLTFKTQSSPYKFCQEIFRQSHNDYVLYQAVTTVKEALVKEWVILNQTDIDFWQTFLLAFVCERKNLQKYVVEKSLQCIAVLVKRGTLDDSSKNFLHHLITNIHQLFSSNDLTMRLLACSMIKALLYEYSSMGRTCDIRLSFEFHYKCKAHFESTHLQQFFIISVQALQTFANNSASSLTKDYVDVLSSLLSMVETILSWKFSPKNLLRIFHVRSDDTQSLVLFKPGSKWRDTLINGNCLAVFVNLHPCVKNHEQLVHQYFLCLTQLASVSGSIFADDSATVQYLGQLLHGVLELGQQYNSRLSGIEATGFASVINRILAVFPAHLLYSLPSELVQAFLHSMSHLTQTFLQTAMKNQEMHDEDTSHMEAFNQILVAWVNLVSSSSSFPKGFLSGPCFEIFHLYVKAHISSPEGTRNTQGQQDLEEFVELTDTDLEEFDDQLNSIAQMARHVLSEVVPFLNRLLDQKVLALLDHLRLVKEKGPLAADTVQTENLYEDLHWLILITGYILSDKVSSETSLMPDEIIMYSISEAENINIDETVKHLTSLGTGDHGNKRIDSVTKLITSVLKVADVEKQALDAGLGPTISPELGSNIVWILQKVCDVYLMPTESEYGQVSVSMVTTFGKGTESGQWLVGFILQKIYGNFRCWLSEVTVLEATAQLFVTLMANESSARAAVSCDVLAQLAKDYAEHSSYVKELPSVVQRGFSKALVVAGSAMGNENDRKQYLCQILNPIKTRFDTLVKSPTFCEDAQHEAIKDEVERLLECFRGVANATCMRTRPLLFTCLVPVLNDCVVLLDVYNNCSETVELVLSLLLDVVEYHLACLAKEDSQKLQNICISLMEVYSKCSSGKRKGSVLAEEETFIDLLIFMKILTNILEKEYLLFTDESDTPGFETADIVLYGLNILLPFITRELLKFPELKDHYFKLITLVCEEHSEKICQMPDALFTNLMKSLEQGLQECETDITKATLEALWGMAIDLFRQQNKPQEKPTTDRLSNALKSMLKVLFNFVMFEKFEVMDLIVPVADALWVLICCHQAEYTSLVQGLLAAQTDPLVHQRLVDSFNQLTPSNLAISIEKHAKEQFRKNLDVFLANVKGLLCVK